jgi:teichuronic acid exporter
VASSSVPRGALSPRGLLAAASWMSGTNLVAQAVAYAALLVLARLVSPGSFGTVAAATSIVWMVSVLLDSGTRGGIIVQPRVTEAHLRREFRRCLVAALALGVAMALASPLLVDAIAEGGDAAVVAALAASLPLYAVALIPMAVLQRTMHFGRLAQATGVANAGSAILAVLAGLAGLGVWALVTRQLLWVLLLAVLATVLVRPYLPRDSAAAAAPAADVRNRWFFVFGATLLIALNVDYIVVGAVEGAGRLGLYALAFMIGFAPLVHVSGEAGRVLFAAAAASGVESSGVRTVRATRLMAGLLLPILPVAVVLAEVALPALLGDDWKGMVSAFQLLIVVGVGQAIVNCIGETLSGVGEIAFRAKVNVGWCAATLAALLLLVPLDGIRGAALAHLIVFVPYLGVYATAGARRAGTGTRELWAGLRGPIAALACQAAVTAAVAIWLGGTSDWVAACAGAAAGLLVVTPFTLLDREAPLREIAAIARGRHEGGR